MSICELASITCGWAKSKSLFQLWYYILLHLIKTSLSTLSHSNARVNIPAGSSSSRSALIANSFYTYLNDSISIHSQDIHRERALDIYLRLYDTYITFHDCFFIKSTNGRIYDPLSTSKKITNHSSLTSKPTSQKQTRDFDQHDLSCQVLNFLYVGIRLKIILLPPDPAWRLGWCLAHIYIFREKFLFLLLPPSFIADYFMAHLTQWAPFLRENSSLNITTKFHSRSQAEITLHVLYIFSSAAGNDLRSNSYVCRSKFITLITFSLKSHGPRENVILKASFTICLNSLPVSYSILFDLR